MVFPLKNVIVFFLKIIKKIRGFDKGFMVYMPDFNNKRESLLWKLMVLNPLFNMDINLGKVKRNEKAIDICIVASGKDMESLPATIKAAIDNIDHLINKLYIIAPEIIGIKDICQASGAVYVNENAVLGYKKDTINYMVDNNDRSGWLFQQLLKLNADTITEMEDFLILDADTAFIRPRVFFFRERAIFDVSTERHEPYHSVYQKILKRATKFELSFVAHYMLFNKTFLRQLKAEIESIHKKKWDTVILENTDYSNISGFSEYELYGNYLFDMHPGYLKTEYWFNAASRSEIHNYTKSVSEHVYL